MRFADLQPSNNAKRVLKPVHEISQLLKNNPDTEDIFLPRWVLDIYPARPDKLQNVSLYELLGWYEREKLKKGKEPLQLKGYNIYLRRRTAKPYIITYKLINPQQSQENKELYFYQLLKLFKPWRLESDLCLPGKNFYETYIEERRTLLEMRNYHEANIHMTEQEEQTEKEIENRAERITAAEEQAPTAEDQQSAFEGCRVDAVQSAIEDVMSECVVS